MSEHKAKITWKRFALRATKVLAVTGAAVVGLAVVLLVLLMLRPVRERILSTALPRIQSALPGDLALESPAWPSLGSIRFEGIVWTDGPDTLAAADELRASVDLLALTRRDIHVEELFVANALVDIPSIIERFQKGESPEEKTPSKDPRFPRKGALPGVPSLAVDNLEIDARRVRVSKDIDLRKVAIRAAADLRAGAPPELTVSELTLTETVSGASIDSLWLAADLSRWDFDGNGTINIPGGRSWHLLCRSSEEHEFGIYVTEKRDAIPPNVLGIALEGQAVVTNARFQSADFELVFKAPGTEELQKIPALKRILSEPLEKLTPLDGVSGAVEGEFVFEPEVSVNSTLELSKNSWLDGVRASVAYTKKTLVVDTLHLTAPGLSVSASADIPQPGGSASAHVVVTDSKWLTRIVPDASLPESTMLDIVIEADGLVGTSQARISLKGNAVISGNGIDEIDLAARVPADRDKPVDLDILIAAFGTSLATHAQVSVSPSVEAILSRSTTHQGENTLAGNFGYHHDDRSLLIDDLEISGSIGELTVNASLDSTLQGGFDVALRWVEPPPLLFDKLSADSTAFADIDSAWRADGPFELRIDGDLARSEGGAAPNVSATAELRLPGPRDFASLIDGEIAVDDLGPIEGSLRLTTGTCAADAQSFSTLIDLGRTTWLDTALFDLTGCGTSIAIDTVLVGFDNLRLTANGLSGDDGLDLRATLGLADSLLLTRLLSPSQVPSVSLDATVHLTGTADAPRIESSIEARYSTPDVKVPRIAGAASLANDSLYASILCPKGVRAYNVVMDSVSLVHSGIIGDSLSGRTSLKASGPDTRALYNMRWEKNGGIHFYGDTLYLNVMDEDIRSAHPFRLSVVPGGEVRIDGLQLQGSVGHVTADGYAAPDSADFNADIVIHTSRKPRFLELADRLWPDSLIIAADIDDPNVYRVSAVVAGIEITGQTPVSARLDFHSNPDSTSAHAIVDSPDSRLLEITGSLPTYHLGDKLGDGPVVLDVRIDRFPIPANYEALTADKPQLLGWLGGRIAVRGTARDPSALAVLRCEFAASTGGNELAEYRLDVEGQLKGEAAMDTALVRVGGDWFQTSPPDLGTAPGFTANLSMTKSGNSVLTGVLAYPVTISLAPPSAVVSKDIEMNLEITSSDLALTDFDPVLPPDINLEGTCKFQFSATGRANNPSLNGSLRTRNLQIESAKRSQIAPNIQVDLGGTMARPAVKGDVTIRSGFIRVPEQQSQLHPSKGSSILQQAVDSARASADTTGAGLLGSVPDSLVVPEIQAGLDLDVRVLIPGSFRIISSRMNIVLSGDLSLVQKGEQPVLTGQLIPESGNLMFMGRSFELRRGFVNFYGDDELNPGLDLTLTAEVSSHRIEIRLTGSLKDPELALTSDPQLAESDIMSLLVFGKPMGELSTSQSGHVQQRTAEILMGYGAVKLQEQMSNQMGVDIVTIKQSTRKADESALVVGKYLNSRTLIRYEQNLENTGAYLLNLEYILTKRLKLQTFVDQASATGVEINWSKDY